MIRRLINFIFRNNLYDDYKKHYILRKINYHLNNNFFTNQNIKYKNHTIGNYTYGKPRILFDWWENKLIIWKYCSIGEWTKVFLGWNHRYDWVSTYPFHQVENISWYEQSAIQWNWNVVIWNDVRIWMNVTILSWITIGDGAVIGYGSLITRDVEAYSIVWGCPAKLIKKRFSDEIIRDLLELQWWNIDHWLIQKHIPFLLSNNIQDFITNLWNEQ
jgi:acetyltransferase-like isoleucine patch superfamily enzyme